MFRIKLLGIGLALATAVGCGESFVGEYRGDLRVHDAGCSPGTENTYVNSVVIARIDGGSVNLRASSPQKPILNNITELNGRLTSSSLFRLNDVKKEIQDRYQISGEGYFDQGRERFNLTMTVVRPKFDESSQQIIPQAFCSETYEFRDFMLQE